MNTIPIPATVQEALGKKAADDLATWLDKRLELSLPTTQISAYTARQKANVFVLEHVSNLLLADTPELQKQGSRWVWLVPVDLTLKGRGRLGRVGAVEIDATYGEIHYSDILIRQMIEAADRLSRTRPQILGA
jgi:hypothetical protein